MSNEEFASRIKKLEEDLANKEEIIQSLSDEIANLTAKLEKSRISCEEQISKIAEEQDKMNSIREQRISELQTELAEFKEMLDGNKGIKELQMKASAYKTVMEKRKKEVDTLTSENEKLKVEFEKYKSKLDELKGKGVKELQSLLNKKEAEVAELNIKIAELQSLQSQTITEQQDIVVSFEKQANRIKELEVEIQGKKTEIERLSTGLDAKKMQAYDEFVNQLQSELNEVKTNLLNSERLRDEQSESIERFEAIIEQIQTQIEQQEAVQPHMVQQTIPTQVIPEKPIIFTQPIPAQPIIPEKTLSMQPIIPAKPLSAQPVIPTTYSQPIKPIQATPTAAGSKAVATQLLDSITAKARSGMAAAQLGVEMETIRSQIVEVFEWHPTLFELAAFARRLKQMQPGIPLDPETLQLLIEKIEAWKSRIMS
ncbi:MAG TPA: hypothetical protein VMV49_11045 [Candidatus Deferrimicrobium sp.]|nr:hypothetical protein [Candidatus Deferrimicrobium sp.]